MNPWCAATTLAYKQSVPKRTMAQVTPNSLFHDVLTGDQPGAV